MNYLEKNKENFLKDLKGLIKIKSYLNDPKKYPNSDMKKAVDYIVNLGKREGFKTYSDSKGYYGWVEIGEGKELIGILGHLDVVPPGNEIDKWNFEPFDLNIDGDKLFGRGTQDDKGPVMMCFYLLKSICESNLNINKRIRLIFPTDEESFWRGVEKYKNDNQEIPNYGITPDSTFPIIYSERELWEFKISGKPTKNFIFNSGGALNIVPDKAEYKCNDCNKNIITKGKASHAMEPNKGKNAITNLIFKIKNINNDPLINFIKNEIKKETNGKTLFGKIFKDDDSELTLNLAKLIINENVSEAYFDIRIPNTSSSIELKKILVNKLKEKYNDLKYEDYDQLNGVFIEKNSKLMKELLGSYQEITGDKKSKPIATGGATYARSMKNIIAFGPYFPKSVQTEHQYNEYARFSDFSKAFEIYSLAFQKFLSKK